MMRDQSRDYDYVEAPHRPPPSEAERLHLYGETRALLRQRIVQSLGNLSGAKKSYDTLTERSPSGKARNRSRHLWIALRLENEYRHEAATKNAPARMVASMLDNWPAWYPQHLKPSPEDAAADTKRLAKRPRKRKAVSR